MNGPQTFLLIILAVFAFDWLTHALGIYDLVSDVLAGIAFLLVVVGTPVAMLLALFGVI